MEELEKVQERDHNHHLGGTKKAWRAEKREQRSRTPKRAKMKKRLQVMKFGGTSVGDASCIARAAKIIVDAAKEHRCVAVVSAMSGVTNRLIEAANQAQAGNAA